MAEETVRLWPTSPIWDAVGIGHEKGDHFGLGASGYVDVPKGPQALALIKKGGYVEMPDPVGVTYHTEPMVLMRAKDPRSSMGGNIGVADGNGNWVVPTRLADSLISHGFEYVTDAVGLPVAGAVPGSALDRLSELEPAHRAAIGRIAEMSKVLEAYDEKCIGLEKNLTDMDAAMRDAAEQIVAKDARIAELEADLEPSDPVEPAHPRRRGRPPKQVEPSEKSDSTEV